MAKKITIYDVARKADVSLATVSRVINNSSSVNEKTRARVLQVIDDLKYVPSGLAQGLALNKSTHIAMIVPEAGFSYVSKIIDGVIDVGHIYNYNITLHSTSFGQFDVNKVVERVVKNRIDGVIIINSELSNEILDKFLSYNIPVTVIGTKLEGPRRTSVYVDYRKVMYNLVSTYLEKGVYDMVFIDGEYNRAIIEEMLSGINQAYMDKNLVFKGHLRTEDNYKGSYADIFEYIKNNKPKLVIGARDSLAVAAQNAAQDLGYKIPDDIEVIGFNNTKYSRMARPSLSSMNVPLYEIGAIAARQMTKLLDDEKVEQSNYEVESYLVSRDSTKK